jgi:DnaK suppressor protein
MPRSKSPLGREFVEQQRTRLRALRAQLLGMEERAIEEEQAYQEEHGDEAQDLEDRAQEVTRNESDQSLHDADERRLHNIERALQKIDEGTYGLSDLSGRPIPKARLDVAPEAILTVEEERRAEEEPSSDV